MLDGRPLIDAHQHPVRLPTVKPAWLDWAERYGRPGWREAYSGDGAIIPQAFDDLMRAEGVDHALVICEYSPKATGIQPAEDLLPLIRHNPGRFSLIASLNPHLHSPVAGEPARQLALGAIALKVHPVHGGFSPADPPSTPPTRPAPSGACLWWCTAARAPSPARRTSWPTRPCSSRCSATSPGSPWCSRTAAGAGGTTPRRRWRCCTRTCGSSCPGCRRTAFPTTTRGSTWPGWPASSSSVPTGPACPASPATPAPWPPSAWTGTRWPGCSPETR